MGETTKLREQLIALRKTMRKGTEVMSADDALPIEVAIKRLDELEKDAERLREIEARIAANRADIEERIEHSREWCAIAEGWNDPAKHKGHRERIGQCTGQIDLLDAIEAKGGPTT